MKTHSTEGTNPIDEIMYALRVCQTAARDSISTLEDSLGADIAFPATIHLAGAYDEINRFIERIGGTK